MEKPDTLEKCILCGKSYPAGLHVMGCLICFPCEKHLLDGRFSGRGARARRARENLLALYQPPT